MDIKSILTRIEEIEDKEYSDEIAKILSSLYFLLDRMERK